MDSLLAQSSAIAPAPLLLNATQASGLARVLSEDSLDYLYSGAVSIADAIQAIERGMYTWATVKLYYSLFYLARGQLAEKGTAIFYKKTKPMTVKAVAGEEPKKADGNTHKAVLSIFRSSMPHHPAISNPIDSVDAFQWMIKRREEANYNVAKFSEPATPKHLEKIAKAGVRRSLAAYLNDSTHLYCFDQDHAILALPTELLKQNVAALRTYPERMRDERKYLASLFCDRLGPIAEAMSLFK
jgi:hypothetical protein